MEKAFMYLLDPIMIAAVVVAVFAVALFFVIVLKTRKAKQLSGGGKNQTQNPQKKNGINPQSRQASHFTATDIEPTSFAQKHWGNLSIKERYAMLSPENKVLYAAAKKQLDDGGLKNFTSEICEIYFNGEVPAARLLIYRGLVYLFLNIDPNRLDKTVYRHEDASDRDGYEMLPTMIILKESPQIDKIPQLLGKMK